MTDIQQVAVLGSGVMGASIAALIANSGTNVMLLDIVPDGAEDRNVLAKGAIDKLLKGKPSGFTHKRNARRITPGNLEDDLDALNRADWIVEVVIEKLEIKQDVYRKIDAVRKQGSIVSSNTSTLPLAALVHGMPDRFQRDFMITHFFNPPRFMRLLELVAGPKTDSAQLETIRRFCDVNLGKGVVDCKDTPGFIANRIGCFWLMQALKSAFDLGITVEEADAVMGRPLGFPKTGVFGLFDLIGIDLMPLIAQSFLTTLPKDDAFRDIAAEPELVKNMIADGYTGRKGKGGFYRLNKEGGKKVKEAIDLANGEYHTANKPKLESVQAAKAGLAALLTHDDIGGRYARAVMLPTLAYTASLIPDISDDIVAVDEAMRMGYNWKYGPFELIDRMQAKGQPGTAVFAHLLAEDGMNVPDIIANAKGQPLYTSKGPDAFCLNLKGDYNTLPIDKEAYWLGEITRDATPLAKNASAALWDIGDGVACLEYRSKMNSIDLDIITMIEQSVEIVGKDFKGLVIGNDADNFSVGANLGFVLYASNVAAWDQIEEVIAKGQQAMMGLKYAPFPVVGSLAGMALGGGCETILHCDAVQACMESYIGLVEVGVGLIPGWGGCKEMLLRYAVHHTEKAAKAGMPSQGEGTIPGGPMPVISEAFEMISLAKVAESAEQAQDMQIIRTPSRISMNRKRLLHDAKLLCLDLAKDYHAPEPQSIHLPGATADAALNMAVETFVKNGKATAHDEVVAKTLARVLSGGETDMLSPLSEQDLLDLERQHFIELIKTPGTLARIEHMLETGKPLRN